MRYPTSVMLLACLVAPVCAAPLERHFDGASTARLGRAMYEQDRRAAIAADLVRDNFDPDEERLVGFITTGAAPTLRVRFVRAGANGYEAAIDAVFDGLLLPALERAPSPTLSADEMAQITARLQVARDAATRCDGRYNTVALNDPDGDGMLVYAIAASSAPDTMMVGGHVRYSISVDGERIEHTEALSTSCAAAPLADLALAASTDGVQGLALRTMLAAAPLETHVFLSLMHDTPLFIVGSDLRMWRVDGDQMKVVREKPGPATP